MEWTRNILIQDREHAGKFLSKRLIHFANATNAVVVGIPHGGVCVASAIADALNLPLEVMPCRKIKHPVDKSRNIGSVSANEACVHDCPYDVPQDYIYHQMALIRHAIDHENRFYYQEIEPTMLTGKTVILVDDILQSSDTMMACLRSIKKENPLRVIVAVPIVGVEAGRRVKSEADDIVFLQMEHSIGSGKEYFFNFPRVDDIKVREILNKSRALKTV
ncbi:phosphoribosyltransferase [Fulvivirga imtechensis AK7]|uniref:Phosphoribosyltransferase n=2 Tax=Fulvivirga TaxID=396811 RepID=L8JM48_9BACT|nr:phosphoribosyltransferase [Fulvivirga imtechensis AK7]